jgi:hypothetical protein
MKKRFSVLVAALCGCLLLTCSTGAARADRRVALVVGNSNYTNPSLVLSNPKNDATDVAVALRSLGFEVVQAIDANKRDMDSSMAKFARLATDSDAALFYYAGHALQYQGSNYLMPVDAEVEDEVSLRYQMIAIDDVRAALDRASGVKVMILDACRNNPVADSLRKKLSGDNRGLGGVRGLARIDKTQGTVIAYSTAADDVAADGQGRNSPFTTAFLKRLQEPGLEIEQLFRRVAADVNSATGGRQRPETYVSLLSDYYLNQTDRIAFDAIKDSADPAVLRDFMGRFPASSFASDARYRIQHIEIEAQERQLQQARQQEAARLLEQQSKTDQDVARTKIARADAPNAGKDLPPPVRPPEGSTKLAGVERQDLTGPNPASPALQNPSPVTPAPKAIIEPAQQAPAASSNKSCDQDNARLALLRSGGSLDEVVQFERQLGCDRLRPQVTRLRESLGGPSQTAPVMEAAKPVVSPPIIAALPKPPATPPAAIQNTDIPSRIETSVPPRPPVPAADQTPACKQDEARLTRLRASPSLADVTAFERELGCEKLRPQIVRLRESLAPPDSASTAASDTRSVFRADLAPEAPALSTTEIAKSVKSELNRVGCFTGSIDSEWNAESRRSLDLFNKNAGTKLQLANGDTLDAIRLKPARVCPPVCEHGFKTDGDHCTKIVCAEGSSLNDDNECETQRTRKPIAKRNDDDRPDRTIRERPRTEASTAKPQGSGQIFCDQVGCHPVARGCRVGPIGPSGSGEQICN